MLVIRVSGWRLEGRDNDVRVIDDSHAWMTSCLAKTGDLNFPTLRALDNIPADSRNVVYIVSGRNQAFLEQHLGHIKHFGMSADHGGFIREPSNGNAARNVATEDEETWVNFTEQLDMGWMDEVAEIFRYYTERTTGSHVEVKKSSITWHYRASDPEWGLFQCRQCQDMLENNLAHKRPIEVLVGKKNLEVRPLAVNKALAETLTIWSPSR